jgi:ATP-dependent DNA helicase PIF1
MNLSEEQQIAFDKYILKQNIFITGPGGTGKSTLIKKIFCDANQRNLNIQICALTGCAAVLLECKAKTIHSWSGIGLGVGPNTEIVRKLLNSFYKKKIWRNVNILVIDEVSMMSSKLFELLDLIGKSVRRNNKPFGGIQLVFLGDFYQLPPIGNKEDTDAVQFCFESLLWRETFYPENIIQLKKIFRQKDESYTKILNQIREGRLKKSSNTILLGLVGKELISESGIIPTKLFPTRYKVDAINQQEMNKLESEEIEYKLKYIKMVLPQKDSECVTQTDIDNELKIIHNNLICNDTIKLKVGAQVMCIINIERPGGEMICNGSQGIITRFSELGNPLVRYTDGYEMEMIHHIWASDNIPGIGVSQIPLILSWAITIHKSQGTTLTYADIDVGNTIFECGQTYVAMSRVTSLAGLRLSSFDASKIYVNKKVQKFYDELNII